ncbi:MAG: SDR family NAD(P)-dependent oxidoreductase [Actinophytocola sp.]|uniref:SDR family oxidoreductase n=1 Tax=Actinophytocola sp. TaxID=1872138 RepID=UPI001323C592|nr:SDR family oxidoreductase [Actinophytocola sp.]MPZ82423.1 SDR family NAD(P)-dependent oxidoreductase [Actinophytocola sp.]
MARQPRSLAGKIVAITGGGRGIGAATAAALVAQGAKVAIGDLDLDVAKATADKLGGDTVAFPLDVTDRSGFTKFLEEVEGRLGPIDILINNAGIMPLGRFEDESDRSTTHQLEINLHAVIHGTREAVKRMRPRKSGHIVNIASAAGKAGFPGGATYCATKHGVVGLSEAVRMELRGSGVDLSVVMPAIVRTELASGLKEARFFKSVEATDVANAIVRALKKPRFDVYVPASLDAMNRITRLMPRSVAEWIVRSLKGDQILFDAERDARKDYEARAAASAPTTDRENAG